MFVEFALLHGKLLATVTITGGSVYQYVNCGRVWLNGIRFVFHEK